MNPSLSNVRALAVLKTSRTGLLLQKRSPEILLGAGIASVTGAVIYTGIRSLSEQDIWFEYQQRLFFIQQINKGLDDNYYTTSDRKRDLRLAKVQFAFQTLKNYAPALILYFIGVGLLIGSHNILSARNVALMGAYRTLEKAYKEYRRRVREELGEDVDDYFEHRRRRGNLKVVDKDTGKPVKFDEVEAALPGEIEDEDNRLGSPSIYHVYFNDRNSQWRNDSSFNETFLIAQERYANQMLETRGHLFLNEVYDMLDVDRTPAGAIVGWVKNYRDGFVSFDVFNPYNSKDGETLNRQQSDYLLDFNVDGIVYDLI